VKLPKGFLFGLANADHQVESYDPRYPDVWDLWEETQGKTKRERACEFETRYEDDIKLAADLGSKVFRFSISWAKVQLDENTWNEEALDHYRRLAQCIHDHDMKVVITLAHFTWPVWLERDHGGMTDPSFPQRFATYAEGVAKKLGDLADYWITFNEPTQLVHGYIKPWWQEFYYMPPGMPKETGASGEAEAVGKLIHNLFSAHAKARVKIKELNPETQVGVNPLVTGFPSWLQWILDHQYHSKWLLKALYKFSFTRPLVVEKASVDMVMGKCTPTRQNTLFYSQSYESHDTRNQPQQRQIILPANHHGLLEIANSAIAEIQQEIVITPRSCYLDQPTSLADYFACDNEAGPKTIINSEGVKRIKRRGKLCVGIRKNASSNASTEQADDTTKDSIDLIIARRIAEIILGDPTKLEVTYLSPNSETKALRTKASKLNQFWHFFGAAGLIANSNWWYLGSRGKLPEELCPKEAIDAHDFIGFDYYWGLPGERLHQFSKLVDAGEGRFLSAPVWPEGLRHTMRKFHRWFPDQEQLIIENGSVPLADGYNRENYLKLHLNQVEQAAAEGIPIKAYLLWSLTSNREWGHPFDHNTDFGLYHVDLDGDPDLNRVPSKEVEFYKNIIQSATSD